MQCILPDDSHKVVWAALALNYMPFLLRQCIRTVWLDIQHREHNENMVGCICGVVLCSAVHINNIYDLRDATEELYIPSSRVVLNYWSVLSRVRVLNSAWNQRQTVESPNLRRRRRCKVGGPSGSMNPISVVCLLDHFSEKEKQLIKFGCGLWFSNSAQSHRRNFTYWEVLAGDREYCRRASEIAMHFINAALCCGTVSCEEGANEME